MQEWQDTTTVALFLLILESTGEHIINLMTIMIQFKKLK